MPIQHTFVSTIADSEQPDIVQPSHWNAVHTLPEADEIAVTDAGGYYTGTDVESVLQEVGDLLAMSGAGGGAITDGVNSAIKATVFDYTSSNPLAVRLSDTNGDYVSVGGGTQYTEDAAAASDPVGNAIIVVRDDSRGGSLTTANGDNVALRGTNYGELYVKHTDSIAATQSGTWNVGTVATITNVVHVDDNSSSLTVDNGGTFAIQDSQVLADNAGFTDGTTKVFMGGYIYDEVAGTALTENDAAAARINANRAQVQTIEDGSTRGRYVTVTAANALKVDASSVAVPVTDNSGSLTVDAPVGTPVFVRLSDGSSAISTLPVSIASGATAIAKAEDVASADADVGVPAMAIRKATPANTSGTDGDYEMLQMSAGRLWVDASGKTLTVDGSGVTQPVSGTVTATMSNGKTLTSKGGSVASSGDNTLVTAGSNKLKVYAFSLTTTSTTAVTCIFQSGASGAELWRWFYKLHQVQTLELIWRFLLLHGFLQQHQQLY
jgi:hypothetical protein